MIIRKRIKAGLLKKVIKLPQEITDDTILDLIIEEADPSIPDDGTDEPFQCFKDIKTLFESRIRAAGTDQNFVEEVFSLDEIAWQDLNEIKASFEAEGYGVKIDQQDNFVRVKILWRYA